MTHILKILSKFADSILIGFNTFEILENGRQFHSGDYIRFQAMGDRIWPCERHRRFLLWRSSPGFPDPVINNPRSVWAW